ncbi:MAG: efflux RND transporter periplasmic adaptor subunit [Nitrosomonadales bacterium]|nr:efflux RND transporter periplasmic adaptor subunit [Nitrosomonadales bacterium]
MASLPLLDQTGSQKIWVCPMHPEITQDHPGDCPICGMKLVEAKGTTTHEHGVHVDSATVQRLGVRLARIQPGVIGQSIRSYGNVVVDENATFAVQPKYEGWIKKLYVHAPGETVKAGQVLYEIYSPELYTRLRTYLSSIERRKQLLQTIPTTPDTESDYVMEMAMDAANDRSKLHQEEGVSITDILDMERTKQAKEVVQIVAARSGVVSRIEVKEGSFAAQGSPILLLADVSRVRVDIALYPDQVAQVKVGDEVSIRDAVGRVAKARIDLINPLADNNKVIARATLDNSLHHWRPGTFVDVSLMVQPHEALLLPRSAVLVSGRGSTVMLSRGEGRFLPVAVETGMESGDSIEIVEGLLEGAEVAVNGQFLLDAAASMSAATERMRSH